MWNIPQVWKVKSGNELICINHEYYNVKSLIFSPDNKFLAAWGYDNSSRVWKVSSSNELAEMTHEDVVNAATFSPNGKFLATASRDNTARIWEVNTGKEVTRIIHEDDVENLAFSPNGQFLVTSSNNIVRVWIWRSTDLIKEACSRLTRNLTLEEWQSYIGDEPYRPTCPNL